MSAGPNALSTLPATPHTIQKRAFAFKYFLPRANQCYHQEIHQTLCCACITRGSTQPTLLRRVNLSTVPLSIPLTIAYICATDQALVKHFAPTASHSTGIVSHVCLRHKKSLTIQKTRPPHRDNKIPPQFFHRFTSSTHPLTQEKYTPKKSSGST